MTLLPLCEIASVKVRLDITDTDSDALLTTIVNGVSAAIESYLDRKLFAEERTEYHTVADPTGPILLRSYPITAIASVKNDTSWDWGNATALDATDYDFDSESGLLHIQGRLARGPRSVQVVYTAGLATSAADVESNYPNLSVACAMQSAEEFLRKEAQGDVSFNLSDGGGTMNRSALEMLPSVVQRLAPFRRVLL